MHPFFDEDIREYIFDDFVTDDLDL